MEIGNGGMDGSEIKFGKVHEIQSFSQNSIVVIWSWWLYSAQCNIFKTMRLYSSIVIFPRSEAKGK